MAIVQNANEEHQFVFAVNTISMVKSDALFSYVAPTNILAWVLTPLRYFLPFRLFVKVNRTVIKITHFPILFSIYLYERTILQSSVVDGIDVIEPQRRSQNLFTQKLPRLKREPSVATFRQDRALEEVFRRPFDSAMRSTMRQSRQSQERKTSNVVSNWMKSIDEVVPSSLEQDRKTVDSQEIRSMRRPSRKLSRVRDFTRSVASDPQEFAGSNDLLSPDNLVFSAYESTPPHIHGPTEVTDADGDGRLRIVDNDDAKAVMDRESTKAEQAGLDVEQQKIQPPDYFSVRDTTRTITPGMSRSWSISQGVRAETHISSQNASGHASPPQLLPHRSSNPHLRNASSTTIVYKPVPDVSNEHPSSQVGRVSPAKGMSATKEPGSGHQTPSKPTSGHRTPKRTIQPTAKPRPIMPPKENSGVQSTPNFAGFRGMNNDTGVDPLEMDLVSDIGDNKAIGGGFVGAIPASFATQLAYATGGLRERNVRDEDRDLFGRLMMARMNSLEEGFREIVHEMRENLRREGSRSRSRSQSRSRERGARYAHHHHQSRKGKEKPAGSGKENENPGGSAKDNVTRGGSNHEPEAQVSAPGRASNEQG